LEGVIDANFVIALIFKDHELHDKVLGKKVNKSLSYVINIKGKSLSHVINSKQI